MARKEEVHTDFLCGFVVPRQKQAASDKNNGTKSSIALKQQQDDSEHATAGEQITATKTLASQRRSSRRRSLPPERFGDWVDADNEDGLEHYDGTCASDRAEIKQQEHTGVLDPETSHSYRPRLAHSFEELTHHSNFAQAERIQAGVQDLLEHANAKLPTASENEQLSSRQRQSNQKTSSNRRQHAQSSLPHQQRSAENLSTTQSKRFSDKLKGNWRPGCGYKHAPVAHSDGAKEVHQRIKEVQQRTNKVKRSADNDQHTATPSQTAEVLTERPVNTEQRAYSRSEQVKADPHEECKKQLEEIQAERDRLRAQLNQGSST